MHENSNKRLLFLPPGVQKGKEREPKCEDFLCLDSKSLGQGAFGEVFKVRHKISGKDFAIKVIPKKKIIEKRMLGQLRREIRIMYSINHPNIISLYSHFEDVNNFYLILELAQGGQLYTKLKKFKNFEESIAAQYLREVCLAVQYLHSRIPPIIHRDIKPENILLDIDDKARLGDFGWSNFLDDERDTYCGTLEYLAPEMVERIGHGVGLDIWALGVLLFEMLTGSSPFRSRTQEEMFSKIRQGKIVFPKSFPLLAKDLVKRLLQVDPDKRLTVEMVLEHSWILSHAPLRPTADLVKDKVNLPNVPDEGDIDFTESQYVVVSSTKLGEQKPSPISNKTNLEIALKQEEVKRLQSRIEKLISTCSGLDTRINQYSREIKQYNLITAEIEKCSKKIHEIKHKNNLIFKRYTSEISQIKHIKKNIKILDKKLWKAKNDNTIKNMKLNLLQLCSQQYYKLNCFKLLKSGNDELEDLIVLIKKSIKNPAYIKLAETKKRKINDKLTKPTDIEKIIPEFKKILSVKSKSLKSLHTRLTDLKSTSLLQTQIIKIMHSS
jgi:aurora kinase, other